MDSRITTANEADAPVSPDTDTKTPTTPRSGEIGVLLSVSAILKTSTQGPGDNGNKKKEAPRHNRNDVSRLRGFHETP